jgi:microcystin-dependent protein
MAVTPYNRVTSFQLAQQEAPTSPLPGDDLDAELNAVKNTLDELIDSLGLIQRDDGELANAIVNRAQLAPSLNLGFNPPAAWLTAHNYDADVDTVFTGGKFYKCIVSHLSGVFATDLAAAKWLLIADFAGVLGSAINVNFTPTGTISATNSQAAIAEVSGDVTVLQNLGITQNPPVAPTQTSTDNTTKVATTAFVQTRGAELAATAGLLSTPIGGIIMWGGGASTVPANFALCDGATYLRSNAALFSAIGTTHGIGNGTTTANLPDMRGCAPVGLDTGTFANRVTAGGAGFDARTAGQLGGAETVTLSTAQIPSHNHTLHETAHSHGGIPASAGLVSGPASASSSPVFMTPTGATTATATTGITIDAAGGGGAHSNAQPSRVVPFIIRVS